MIFFRLIGIFLIRIRGVLEVEWWNNTENCSLLRIDETEMN